MFVEVSTGPIGSFHILVCSMFPSTGLPRRTQRQEIEFNTGPVTSLSGVRACVCVCVCVQKLTTVCCPQSDHCLAELLFLQL